MELRPAEVKCRWKRRFEHKHKEELISSEIKVFRCFLLLLPSHSYPPLFTLKERNEVMKMKFMCFAKCTTVQRGE